MPLMPIISCDIYKKKLKIFFKKDSKHFKNGSHTTKTIGT